jgi:hypothetical protein
VASALLAFAVSPDRRSRLSQVSNRPPPNRTCTFQCIRLSSRSLWMVRIVSARRITRTFTSDRPTCLAPFAMWLAFPTSDYYGASVALGVSPFRRSRLPYVVDVQVAVGALFVSLRSL